MSGAENNQVQQQQQQVEIVKKESIEKDAIFAPHKEKAKRWLSKARATNMDSINFTDERFELLLDARGFPPETMKCTITANSVEIEATRSECTNESQKNVHMSRNYQLPQTISPQQALCCLSSEGILLITVPWHK